MIKIIKKTVVMAMPLAIVIGAGSAQFSHAGVFDNLVDAANGALATYGGAAARANRADLPAGDIAAAIHSVLKLGAQRVVVRLEADGYSDTAVRIELPRAWSKAKKISARIGYSREFDELERKMNLAAVAAAPVTRDLINQLLERIEFDDPRGILNGNDIAATQYLRIRINDRLAARLKPVIDDLLAEAGALDSSSKIVRRIGHLPMVKNLKIDLADYVVEESLNGFFYYLAKEEQATRLIPEKRTTDLLRRVFG